MKKSIKAITDILTACGCKPAATTDRKENTLIKVHAPTVTAKEEEKQ